MDVSSVIAGEMIGADVADADIAVSADITPDLNLDLWTEL